MMIELKEDKIVFRKGISKKISSRQLIKDKKRYLIQKRIFDIVFSIFVIVFILIWLFPIIALLIKLTSKGPVLFKQKRVGFMGNSFTCYKFRTMLVNEEANTKQAVDNDPRITNFGYILRLSNLDELPQFFNVLIGNMSIVGPRPHMHKDCVDFSNIIDNYRFRNLVKPGITGLAQVKGCRGPAKTFSSIFKRYQWDCFYVRNLSLGLDIRIIKLTIITTLKGFIYLLKKEKKQKVQEINYSVALGK